MLSTTDSAREARLRRRARSEGFALERSRVRSGHVDDQGGYRLIDPDANCVVCGERFDLDLDDVERFLDQ